MQSSVIFLIYISLFNAQLIQSQTTLSGEETTLSSVETTLSPDEECQVSVVKKFSAQLFEILGELQNLEDTASCQELRDIAGKSAATLSGALQAARVCPTLDCLDKLGAKTLSQFADLNEQIAQLESTTPAPLDGEKIKSLNTQSSNLIDEALKQLALCGDEGSTGTDEDLSTTSGF